MGPTFPSPFDLEIEFFFCFAFVIAPFRNRNREVRTASNAGLAARASLPELRRRAHLGFPRKNLLFAELDADSAPLAPVVEHRDAELSLRPSGIRLVNLGLARGSGLFLPVFDLLYVRLFVAGCHDLTLNLLHYNHGLRGKNARRKRRG